MSDEEKREPQPHVRVHPRGAIAERPLQPVELNDRSDHQATEIKRHRKPGKFAALALQAGLYVRTDHVAETEKNRVRENAMDPEKPGLSRVMILAQGSLNSDPALKREPKPTADESEA